MLRTGTPSCEGPFVVILPGLALPPSWLWTSLALYAGVLLWSAHRAPWRRLREGEMQHVFLGASVLLMFLWTIRGGLAPGLGVHLLGATVLTLMFGWRLALLAMALALAGTAVYGLVDWATLGVNGLVGTVVPVVVSQALLRLVERHLPAHLFIYIFLCGFLGAGLAMAASVLAEAVFLAAAGTVPGLLSASNLPYLPLLMLPEAFLNGTLVTALVGMRPRWIWTFDDGRYLHGK